MRSKKGARPNEYVITIIRRLAPSKQIFSMPIAGILKTLTIAVISTLLRVVGQILVKIFLFFFSSLFNH